MKRLLAIILILTMIFMTFGCASVQEESAFSEEVVEGGEKVPSSSESEEETDAEETESDSQEQEEESPSELENNSSEDPSVSEEKDSQSEEETPEEEAQEPSREEEQPAEEEEQPEEEKAMIKVASYNIKSLMHGDDTDGIIQELKEIDADIVGLQEVDKNTTRSGENNHQVELLAKALGYPYWSFDKLIDFQGGEYGMAILSRYPILNSEVVEYKDQQSNDSHVRKYGRHELQVGDQKLVFYNTHLCIRDDNDAVSTKQLKEVLTRMKKDGCAVLTGDFNMPATTLGKTMSGFSSLEALNDGREGKIGKKAASKYIDNIIISKTMEYEFFDNGFGIEVNITEYSDHNLVYAYLTFRE